MTFKASTSAGVQVLAAAGEELQKVAKVAPVKVEEGWGEASRLPRLPSVFQRVRPVLEAWSRHQDSLLVGRLELTSVP